MDTEYYKNVADYMPVPLPRPVKRAPLRDEDGEIIPIITVLCEGAEW